MVNKLVALVTGANKGIGLEIARQLGARGIAVVVGARDEEKAANATSMLKGEGADITPLKLDVTKQSDIDGAAAFLQEKFGRLDILINNAGFTDVGKEDSSLELFRSVYETNVFRALRPHQSLASVVKGQPGRTDCKSVERIGFPKLHQQRSGRIVYSTGLYVLKSCPEHAYGSNSARVEGHKGKNKRGTSGLGQN